MPQSKIRSLQLNSSDFVEIVETALGAPLNLVSLEPGSALTLTGSPIQWEAVVGGGGGGGVNGGDGITVTGGSPTSEPATVAVDSTVARSNITTETFSFAGDVSLNLNDTSQAADEDIWRIGATGSSFIIATRTDADGAGANAISITRTSTTVDDVTIPAPLLLTSSGEASTSTALQVTSNNPTLVINKNNATANQGVWDVTGGTDGQLIWRTRTDAFGTGATWLTVNRSTTTVGDIAFTGTRLLFNGVPVKVGSPDVGGGSQTPWTSDIDGGGFGLDNIDRLEIQAPGIPGDNATFTHDGTDFDTVFVNTQYWDLTGSGWLGLRIVSSDLTLTAGNITMSSGDLDVTGNVDATAAITGLDVTSSGAAGELATKFGADLVIYDSTNLDEARFAHDGTNLDTTFVGTNDWRIRRGLEGAMHVTANFGSPDILTQASTTNPALRVGYGSPFTTVKPAQVHVIDKFDATVTTRNTFADTELSISAENPGVEILGRSASFFDILYHDTTTSYVAMEINSNAIDLIDLPLARVKLEVGRDTLAATENNYNASTNVVTFATPNAGGSTITGKLSGGDGQIWTIHNVAGPGSPAATDNITISHESGSSVANARFQLPGATNLVIPSFHSATFVYDDATAPNAGERWRLMSTSGF